MDRTGSAFKYLAEKFPRLSETKIKEGVFVGPQIRKLCGDINIDYLDDSDRKAQLEALLKTYYLTSVINFPTRTHKLSATAIDNIFIDI